MPKQLDGMLIEVQVAKDSTGKVVTGVDCYVNLGTTEYPELGQTRQPGKATVTSEVQALATSLAEEYLADELVAEGAEDNIPIPDTEP